MNQDAIPATVFDFLTRTREAYSLYESAIAGVPESNWLPSTDGKPFSLTFRTYVPKDVVKRGEWQPAPVTRAN